MSTDQILELINSDVTLTKAVTSNPKEDISKLADKLYADIHISAKKIGVRKHEDYKPEDLDRAEKCGQFPYRPSDLFLKIYSDVLNTIERDPWVGMVSPPLLASSGVIPLSIVSVIPDIMRHYRNLIANAETEVMIATNYWETSYSSSLVHDALIELSKRHEGKPTKPVVKLIYDRGNPKQVIKNHQRVPPEEWDAVGLPKKEEIPNIEFEVMNYHRPIMGTFHAKYMIVDRKVACLNSNNIQDRVNVEMMTHLEGPIVDAFYDMSLLSWAEPLQPPLPLLKRGSGRPKAEEENSFSGENRYLKDIYFEEAAKTNSSDPKGTDPRSNVPPAEMQPTKPREDVSALHREDAKAPAPDHLPPDADDDTQKPDTEHPDPIAKQHIPVQETPGVEEVRHADAEIAAAESKYGASQATANHLNAGMQHTKPTAGPEVAQGFHPHILHKPHKPFPIAMVNRPPRGTPGHGDVDVPQNVAWLAGFRLAKKNIFIQTPTFNATPVVKEILDACRRGVECILYLDLGFNDGGEMLPGQGGTNSKVVAGMYKTLNAEGKQQHLKVYWYVAKDQEKPIDAAEKRRNCHVKFCTIDDQVAIQGNGNQDTQSWFHSQEINVMVDSPEMCAEWRAGIDNNQNTALYGQVDDKDGLWRDKDGNVVEGKGGKGGPVEVVKGLFGAVARVRGKGGF